MGRFPSWKRSGKQPIQKRPFTIMACRGSWSEQSLGKGMWRSRTSEEKRLFTEWGQGVQWMKALVRNSSGISKPKQSKAIHWRGFGQSVNRRTLRIEIFCAHPLPKSPLLVKAALTLNRLRFRLAIPNRFSAILLRFTSLLCFSWESLNGGLANGGLRYLSTIVHDCLRLSSLWDESSP